MKQDSYYEVRTGSGTVIQQFTTESLLKKWLSQRKNFDYLPSYGVFLVTKKEEKINVNI